MDDSTQVIAKMWEKAEPHTFIAMQHLVMAMAKLMKNSGKTGLFGRDKGLSAMKKFEDKLRNALFAMILDEQIKRNATPQEFCEEVKSKIDMFRVVFPNWQEAYAYAEVYFVNNKDVAEDRIRNLLR
ncbi:hypothetical protein DSCA_60720 [Desulfosarcina alkanivorans]|uniref:Uncharacterized protein n=1 Tax=Desulfosarcina alkanivorans TaxID=571177 RepID=A0A5K7YQT1_9BACT|nr:hypothetical protein [Desulfosarcina alkanivorans]BBO72142.1 hypothetical protein DSCA_60720 [Desulfosarcina alkanivorans]